MNKKRLSQIIINRKRFSQIRRVEKNSHKKKEDSHKKKRFS